MNLALVVDPLFLWPFFTGLLFAALLPLVGAYLRLREEWLAALAFAQTAAAGALLALALGWPLLLGGMASAAAAVGLKRLLGDDRGTDRGAAYALLLLLGWGVSVLLVANLPLAERVGHALFDGQLYFTDAGNLLAAALCAVAVLAGLRRQSRALLLARFFPDFFASRGGSAARVGLIFDTLVALALALATMSVGVMAAFALVFVPPLLAWRRAGNWRQSLWLALVIGVVAHVAAFAAALLFDQPYGPLLAVLLVALGVGDRLLRRSG